jgi:hypothetical protein
MAGPIKPIASSAQIDLGLEGSPEQLQRKKSADPGYKEVHEKYNPPEKDRKGKAAENEEFKDKRAKSSPLVANAEIAKMKEILDKPKAQPTEQPKMKFGNPVAEAYFKAQGSTGSPGAKIELEKGMMGSNMPKPKLKAGGKVKSASARADGCCIRGRTRA